MAPNLPDPSGPLAAALLATVVVTPVLSLLVLGWYRRAIARSMRTVAQRHRITVPSVPAGVPARSHARARPVPVVVLDETRRAGSRPPDDLWQRARRRLHVTLAVYTAAGLAFGLVAATVWLTDSSSGIGPRNLLALTVLFAWPLVPTLLTVRPATRPAQLLAWAGYAVLLLLASAGTGLTLAATGTLVAILAGPPALMLLALGARPVRTAGPFLAVPVLLTVVGLLLWPELVLWARAFGTSDLTAQVAGVAAAGLLGLAGFAHLAWTARQYARKRAGDQMLTILHWWFLVTAVQSLLLVPSGPGPALAVWAAYLAFRVVLAAGMRLRPRRSGPPRRLLLLRTFAAPRRSEALLRRLRAYWCHVGSVSIIAGPDLAAVALEPPEFLDLLRGRLARRFVGDFLDLRRRVAELADLADEPDPDGRYRVGELFCHDDMWRPALQELLRRTDCVLLDARGFTRAHEGVTFEITQLVQLVALDRVLVLVDDTTDRYHLRTVVDRARLDAVTPDAGGSLRLLRSPGGRLDVATVVRQLGRSG